VAEGCGKYNVRIGRMDANLADDLCVLEPGMRPRFASIGRSVNAVSLDDVAAEACLTHPGVDDVRVGGGDSDGTDR
jgi:hypothetical protein